MPINKGRGRNDVNGGRGNGGGGRGEKRPNKLGKREKNELQNREMG